MLIFCIDRQIDLNDIIPLPKDVKLKLDYNNEVYLLVKRLTPEVVDFLNDISQLGYIRLTAKDELDL